MAHSSVSKEKRSTGQTFHLEMKREKRSQNVTGERPARPDEGAIQSKATSGPAEVRTLDFKLLKVSSRFRTVAPFFTASSRTSGTSKPLYYWYFGRTSSTLPEQELGKAGSLKHLSARVRLVL